MSDSRKLKRARRVWGVLLLCSSIAATVAAQAGEPRAEVEAQPGANQTFLSEDLNVGRFAEIFEGESREVYAERAPIIDVLRLRPGMTVADIGAGTGAFLPELRARVGSKGLVYAVDVSPKFLEHLRQRVRSEKLEGVKVVRGTATSVELPAASLDGAFVCDTYHHFEDPAALLASLYSAIRPGGALLIVDFERIPGTSRDWVLEHLRAGKGVFQREIEASGFRFDTEVPIAGLKENYVLRFVRP